MKIAIISVCAVLFLYVAAQLFLQKTDEAAPIAATPQELAPEAAPPKPLPKSVPSKAVEEPALREAIQATESPEERLARRTDELEQRKPQMSEQDYILETSILNAERSLLDSAPTTTKPLTEEEVALIEDYKAKRKAGTPNPGDAILAALNESSSPAMYFVAGNLFAETGDLENAVDFYATALDSEHELPENLKRRTNKNLGIMLVKKGDFERSQAYLQEAIYLSEEPDTTLHGFLGLAELNSGNLAASEYHYKEAIKIDPTVPDWQVGLTKNLLAQKKYQEAIDQMNAMKANPALGYGQPQG